MHAQVIAEEFNATGPLAPGFAPTAGCDPNGAPLFAKLSETCIASASLGQARSEAVKYSSSEVAA